MPETEYPIHEVHFTIEEPGDVFRVELAEWADHTFTANVYMRGLYGDQEWEFYYNESPSVQDIIDSVISDAERRYEEYYAVR